MSSLLVVEDPAAWPFELEGAQVVSSRDYLTDPRFGRMRRAKVFNLCRDYRYQTEGYYVSLIAAARGHRVLPSVSTLQDVRSTPIVRLASDELEAKVQRALSSLKSDAFVLSIYFGRNVARRYDGLSRALFNLFPAPLLRAQFERVQGKWRIVSVKPIAAKDVPEAHKAAVVEHAGRYFTRPPKAAPRRHRYDLAILWDPDEHDAPSDAKAIERFVKAGRKVGFDVYVIGKEEYGRLAEYDALFIRETTRVAHHTFRFAQRARAEGLVVIDDPESILRCTNKVFQAELFARHGLPAPKTRLVHHDNVDAVEEALGFPMVLKQPDSAFSMGVSKVSDRPALDAALQRLLGRSAFVVAQEYKPSAYDWRVGVLAGAPLFACRYHMARGHWQIQNNQEGGGKRYGKVDAVSLDDAPPEAVRLAVEASRHIGDGLYGVDLKEVDGRFVIIEVNDNPNIEHGYEDRFLKGELYIKVMQDFLRRIEARSARREAS